MSVLLGTAYLFLRDYVSVTDDGILLSLPFWDGKLFASPSPSVPPSPPSEPEAITVVIKQSPTPPPVSPSPEPSPEPVQESLLRAVFLPRSALPDASKIGQIAALCDDGSIDTVVIEVKSPDGGIAIKQSTLTSVLETLQGKASLVAYLSLLEDNTITRQQAAFGIKHQSGVNWLDINKSRWINPYVPEAREWLAEQVTACSELPFDALLFDRLWFPTEGIVTAISWGQYAGQPRADALSALTDRLLEASELPCWAVLQSDVLLGNQPQAEYAAQDTGYFESKYDRLFVRLTGSEADELYGDMNGILPIIQLPDAGDGDASSGEISRIALGSYKSFLAVSAAAEYPAEAFAQ